MPDAADRNLVEDQFPGLNQRFYRGDPAGYFDRRSTALLVSIARPDAVDDLLTEGLAYGSLRVNRSTAPDEDDGQKRQAYASTEATALLHHCAEALFRLLLAHRGLPPCPWLEVARLRNFAQFKAALDDFLGELAGDGPLDEALTVLRGTADGSALGLPDEMRDSDREGVRALLAHLAERLLTDGNLYNAAKHGLAVVGGDAAIKLGDGTMPIDVSADGPSLTYLERRHRSGDRQPRWFQTLTFVNVESCLGWTYLATRQIESLWSIARARYLDDRTGRVHPVSPDAVEHLARGNGKAYQPLGLGMELLYWADEPTGP